MINEVFQSIAERADGMLVTEFNNVRQRFKNSTVKGTGYERAVAEIIRGVVPPTWKIGSGEIIDPYGRRSGQTDLVVALPSQPSLLEREGSNWLFLSASAVAIGETKMALTVSELGYLIAGPAQSWASLDPMRGAGLTPGLKDEKDTWSDRIPVFVFAHEGPTLASIASELESHDTKIDAVFVHSRGVLLRSPGPDSNFMCWTDREAPAAGQWVTVECSSVDVVRTFVEWLTSLPVWRPFEDRPLRHFL